MKKKGKLSVIVYAPEIRLDSSSPNQRLMKLPEIETRTKC